MTTAKRNDSPELPVVMDRTRRMLPWFRPRAAMADRGYDAMSNYVRLANSETTPIIMMRKPTHGRFHGGIYTEKGVPTCLGQVPMRYVRSDPEKGYLYRCAGCHLAGSRGGVNYCNDEVWEDQKGNLRLFGPLRRESAEWRGLYDKRQALERTFKSLKQSRRLERHCVRGLLKVTLHCLMAVLAYQATALVNAQRGAVASMCWMVPKVA